MPSWARGTGEPDYRTGASGLRPEGGLRDRAYIGCLVTTEDLRRSPWVIWPSFGGDVHLSP